MEATLDALIGATAPCDHAAADALFDTLYAELHRQARRELARQGVAILMISSDLEEVLGMSDRVLVLHEGRLAGELSRAELSEEAVMHLATGSASAVSTRQAADAILQRMERRPRPEGGSEERIEP